MVGAFISCVIWLSQNNEAFVPWLLLLFFYSNSFARDDDSPYWKTLMNRVTIDFLVYKPINESSAEIENFCISMI